MYTERFSLPFLAGVLIAALERRRPGLGPWGPGPREALERAAREELDVLGQRFLERFDDGPHWAGVRRTLLEVCVPRYLALAGAQAALEERGWGLWRGGDLVSRAVLGAGGFVLGLLLVRAPFVRLDPRWELLAFALLLLAPLLPDLQVWLHRRRFRRALARLVDDMRAAEAQERLFAPVLPSQPPTLPQEKTR